MRFTHAHAPAALCAPTRYSMLTGNFPWRGREPGGTWGFHMPSQFRDAVSLVPVLTGERDDSQPVRKNLLVQSSPGRDTFDDGGIKGGPLTGKEVKVSSLELHGKEPDADKSLKRKIKKGNLPSDGMAHALYEGDWKLIMEISDKPAALYDLKADLAERHNLIGDAGQADRVMTMEKVYREIRSTPRRTNTL
jgi:arylsulfatase A-like enzyme